MSITKIIDVIVRTSRAIKETEKLDSSLKKLDKSAEDVGKNSKEGFDLAGEAAKRLDNATGGLSKGFLGVSKSAKVAGKSMKGALISTGIGILLVGLALIVEYWDDIVDFIGGANSKLEEQNALLDTNRSLLDRRLTFLGKQKKYNDENNISNDALIEKEKQLLSAKILGLQIQLKSLVQSYNEEASLARQQTLWEKIWQIAPKVTSEEAEALKERETKIRDLQQDLKDTTRLYDDLNAVVFTTKGKDKEKTEKLDKAGSVGGDSLDFGRVEARKTINDLLIEEEQRLAGIEIETRRLTAAETLAIEQKLALEQKQRRQDVANFSIGLAGQTLDIIGGLLEEGSALAKGVAIAQATIKTYEGAVAAYAAGSSVGGPAGLVLGPIAAGLAVVAGLANIAKIAATKPVETNVPGVGGSGGGRAAQAPAFNLVQGTSQNQISESINAQNAKPIEAFVVSSNVTSAQELDRKAVNNSAL
jgi:hypothetical protein